MSQIEFRGVEKRFETVAALQAFDLAVPDGAFLVVLGPSGCGKTTALRIVAGLELPTAGSVLIGNRDVTRVQPRDRDVAMVFQSYALYPHMSVADNIAYPLRIRNVEKHERRRIVERVAESLEVGHLLDRRPRQLSGGQRQRVALARAIVREPQAFLMDEPLSNLDAQLRASMRGEIKRLQKELGTTTLYVTHDQVEATTMADLVAVVRDGVLQQLGPPGEIYDRPANRFVATFVGNPPMNVLSGDLDGNRHAFFVGDAYLPLPDGLFERCASAGVAELGVRPEDLALVEADRKGCLSGRTYVVEPMGNETLVDVKVGEARVTVRAERGWERPIGAPIGIVIDPATVCFFDTQGTTVVHRFERAPQRHPQVWAASIANGGNHGATSEGGRDD
jgi:multiple sugar transport system ATP-binding protein